MLSFLHLGSRFSYYVYSSKGFCRSLTVGRKCHTTFACPWPRNDAPSESSFRLSMYEISGTLPCQTASMQTAFSERNLQLGRETLFSPSMCKVHLDAWRFLFPKGSDTATDDLCRAICRVSGMQAGPAGTRVHRL